MNIRIRGVLGTLLVSFFALSFANTATAARPDFDESKPGTVNCNGKALGHDKNTPKGKALGRGDDCDVVENTAPVADAGPDIDARAGETVTLDGSLSNDVDDDILTFRWTQVSGEPVTLNLENAIVTQFTAPALRDGGELVFELRVSDGELSDTDRVTVRVAEARPPLLDITNGYTIGVRETILVHFDESIDPGSLDLGGDITAYSPEVTWRQRNLPNDTLVIAPAWAWEASDMMMEIQVSDVNGNRMVAAYHHLFDVDLHFETFQAAETVLGQPDFTTDDDPTAPDPGWTVLRHPYGNPAYSRERDILYVSDTSGNRVHGFFGIPETNGAVADVSFSGGSYREGLRRPRTAQVHDNKLVVAEHAARIVIFDPLPESPPAVIGAVVGQDDRQSRETGCAANRMSYSFGSWVTPDGKLLAIDRDNHRVLVWNELPTTDGEPADLVLGQQDFTHCARNDQNGDGVSDTTAANTLYVPRGVWSDGDKVVVADNGNRRLLIWNSFPTSNGQPADVVIGQDSMTENGELPAVNAQLDGWFSLTMWSDGDQLIISDARLHRVLIWNSFPQSNNEPADVVLGQSDFQSVAPDDLDQDGLPDGQASNRTFELPTNIAVAGDRLFVSDQRNHRILIFRSR